MLKNASDKPPMAAYFSLNNAAVKR